MSSGGTAAGAPPSLGGQPADGEGGGAGEPPAPKRIVKAYDDFVVSAGGWFITGDPSGGAVKFEVGGGRGGKLDGAITFTDTGSPTWYFTAPDRYLGDVSELAGGVLRFDLKITQADDPFGNPDVLLTNSALGLTLAYDCTPDPTTSWQSYTVPLSAAGWKVGLKLSGPAATEEQLRQVLSHLEVLRIRGEFNTGADTGWLDNVYFERVSN